MENLMNDPCIQEDVKELVSIVALLDFDSVALLKSNASVLLAKEQLEKNRQTA